jgi:hypothetical protein
MELLINKWRQPENTGLVRPAWQDRTIQDRFQKLKIKLKSSDFYLTPGDVICVCSLLPFPGQVSRDK